MDWHRPHLVVIAFNTKYLFKFWIKYCTANQLTRWCVEFNKTICPCLGIQFSWWLFEYSIVHACKSVIGCHRKHFISHHYQINVKAISIKVNKYYNKPPMVVVTIVATNFDFAPDWWQNMRGVIASFMALSYLLFPPLLCYRILKWMLSYHQEIFDVRFRVISSLTLSKGCALV